MEFHADARIAEKAQPTVAKYALSPGIAKVRKTVDAYRDAASNAGYAIFAVWIIGSVWFAANLPRWVMDSSGITMFTFMIVGGLLGFGIHAVVIFIAFNVNVKKIRKILPGDPLVARVSSDLGVPESEMRGAFETLLVYYGNKSESVHGNQLVKMKLKTKWDDLVADDIDYLRVRREKVTTVASTLITP